MNEKNLNSTDTSISQFLEALGRLDFDELEARLAPDVWFRVLLPRTRHESNTSQEAVEAYRSWYGGARRIQMVTSESFTMAGREFLRYRYLLQPAWAPDEWHVIEQAGFARVREGRISRLDLVCTGFHPVGEAPAMPAGRDATSPEVGPAPAWSGAAEPQDDRQLGTS